MLIIDRFRQLPPTSWKQKLCSLGKLPVRRPSAFGLCYGRQSALPSLLCAIMPVIGDIRCSRVAGAHMRKRGRAPPVILKAQIVQLTESQKAGEWSGGVNAAYFSPSAYIIVLFIVYGVEVALSTLLPKWVKICPSVRLRQGASPICFGRAIQA
jgi:hypothetical protein